MDRAGIDGILEQIRTLSAYAAERPKGAAGAAGAAAQAGASDFQSVLKGSIDAVSRSQQAATQLARAFELGEPGADLARTMVAMQTANVSFQSLVQVRNRLVAAYHEIMNMQV